MNAYARRRATRITTGFHVQAVRLIDSTADHTWNSQRIPQARWWHKPQAKELLELAKVARQQAGEVLP